MIKPDRFTASEWINLGLIGQWMYNTMPEKVFFVFHPSLDHDWPGYEKNETVSSIKTYLVDDPGVEFMPIQIAPTQFYRGTDDPEIEKLARAMCVGFKTWPDELVPDNGYPNAPLVPRWWKEIEWAIRIKAGFDAKESLNAPG